MNRETRYFVVVLEFIIIMIALGIAATHYRISKTFRKWSYLLMGPLLCFVLYYSLKDIHKLFQWQVSDWWFKGTTIVASILTAIVWIHIIINLTQNRAMRPDWLPKVYFFCTTLFSFLVASLNGVILFQTKLKPKLSKGKQEIIPKDKPEEQDAPINVAQTQIKPGQSPITTDIQEDTAIVNVQENVPTTGSSKIEPAKPSTPPAITTNIQEDTAIENVQENVPTIESPKTEPIKPSTPPATTAEIQEDVPENVITTEIPKPILVNPDQPDYNPFDISIPQTDPLDPFGFTGTINISENPFGMGSQQHNFPDFNINTDLPDFFGQMEEEKDNPALDFEAQDMDKDEVVTYELSDLEADADTKYKDDVIVTIIDGDRLNNIKDEEAIITELKGIQLEESVKNVVHRALNKLYDNYRYERKYIEISYLEGPGSWTKITKDDWDTPGITAYFAEDQPLSLKVVLQPSQKWRDIETSRIASRIVYVWADVEDKITKKHKIRLVGVTPKEEVVSESTGRFQTFQEIAEDLFQKLFGDTKNIPKIDMWTKESEWIRNIKDPSGTTFQNFHDKHGETFTLPHKFIHVDWRMVRKKQSRAKK